jgi:hypothetical protein
MIPLFHVPGHAVPADKGEQDVMEEAYMQLKPHVCAGTVVEYKVAATHSGVGQAWSH